MRIERDAKMSAAMRSKASPPRKGSYEAQDIQVLEGLEPVRKRPGMYIGGTGKDGLHHLVWEIVDNAVDEAINGYASRINVVLRNDSRTVEVTDNGRGIPVGNHPKFKKPALEIILTTLHSGGKFDQTNYVTSGGLHGVGSSVVNALSERLTATVRRDGKEFQMEFRRGKTSKAGLKVVGKATRGTGTTIEFTPDHEIFGDFQFDANLIKERLDVNAYLNAGLRISFTNEQSGETVELVHEGGVDDFLDSKIRTAEARRTIERPFHFAKQDLPRVEVALAWTDSAEEKLFTFVNGIPTKDGGTHEQGLKDAIGRAVRNFIETHEVQIPRGISITAEDIREGCFAICSCFLEEPQFQGQTKDRLNNPEMRGVVDGLVRPEFEQWLHDHKSQADAILTRIVMAAKARLASRDATEQVRRKSAVNSRLNLPGKLADCSSSDPTVSEIFIVEGDSAGGSAKQGRDRKTQAILPLRGKVLNAEQASLKKVLENNELSDIVNALGCGIGKDLDTTKLRYHKVVLLMDADSDGHHIATLLLTFFYRHMKPLLDGGYVYLAQPPLYRIDVGKETYWAADDAERDRIVSTLPARFKPEISRFKGLGEMMPKTLYETTLDPQKRHLLKVYVPDGAQLETEGTIANLMGKDPQLRYQAIVDWMQLVTELDV
jgi:DNA gyrase/topoisomerase IV subunit B